MLVAHSFMQKPLQIIACKSDHRRRCLVPILQHAYGFLLHLFTATAASDVCAQHNVLALASKLCCRCTNAASKHNIEGDTVLGRLQFASTSGCKNCLNLSRLPVNSCATPRLDSDEQHVGQPRSGTKQTTHAKAALAK